MKKLLLVITMLMLVGLVATSSASQQSRARKLDRPYLTYWWAYDKADAVKGHYFDSPEVWDKGEGWAQDEELGKHFQRVSNTKGKFVAWITGCVYGYVWNGSYYEPGTAMRTDTLQITVKSKYPHYGGTWATVHAWITSVETTYEVTNCEPNYYQVPPWA